MKVAVKKKDFSKPSINSIKEKLGITRSKNNLTYSSAIKPISFINLPEAFQEATQLPGIPQGYLTLVSGWSNTGKSSLKNSTIASCQRMGILPVIYETENNFDWKYAVDCGVRAEPIYGDVEHEVVDPETGEITVETVNEIVDWEGDFLYFDSSHLAEMYGNFDYSQGKDVKTKRKQAVIEDIAHSINDLLDLQDNGDIQQPICFIWDSVGSLPSYRSVTSKAGNNMFDAAALQQSFNNIVNNRIPESKSVNCKYTNTLFFVNKIWNDSMNSMGGAASIELKGGKGLYYASRLIIHLGGIAKAATKKLKAIAKGETYQYGIETKISVTKNQLPSPYNISYESTMCCVHNGLCSPKKLDEYKKTYAKDLLKLLEDSRNGELGNVNESELSFTEEEEISYEG